MRGSKAKAGRVNGEGKHPGRKHGGEVGRNPLRRLRTQHDIDEAREAGLQVVERRR